MNNDRILVATNEEYAQIRVIGRGAFSCSQNLRDFCARIIESNITKIIIDLSECVFMDSTFMGVLAMIGLQGRSKHISVEIVNIDGVKKKLLKGLGLEKLFVFSHTNADQEVNWESLCNAQDDSQKIDRLEQAKTMLEAHKALVKVNKSNEPKFKNVIEYLKDDMNNLSQ